MGFFDGLFRKSKGSQSHALQPEHPAREDISGETLENDFAEPAFYVGNIQGLGNREQQEDSFALSGKLTASNPQGLLAVVADGMGGMADGKQASQCTVDLLLERFSQWKGETSSPEWLYTGAFQACDRVYRQFGGLSGTTLAAVHIRGEELYWISVGDSAIYLMRNGGLFQLNKEHTYLNQLYVRELEKERIERGRAEQDVDARRLTSFIGIDQLKEVDLNLRPWKLQREDAILLCSDGISGVLTPPEIMEAMSMEPDRGCGLLETMVLEKQVPQQDNYTGIMIAYR